MRNGESPRKQFLEGTPILLLLPPPLSHHTSFSRCLLSAGVYTADYYSVCTASSGARLIENRVVVVLLLLTTDNRLEFVDVCVVTDSARHPLLPPPSPERLIPCCCYLAVPVWFLTV